MSRLELWMAKGFLDTRRNLYKVIANLRSFLTMLQGDWWEIRYNIWKCWKTDNTSRPTQWHSHSRLLVTKQMSFQRLPACTAFQPGPGLAVIKYNFSRITTLREKMGSDLRKTAWSCCCKPHRSASTATPQTPNTSQETQDCRAVFLCCHGY